MIAAYGLAGTAGRWRQAALALAAEVDAQARFPSEAMAALARGGFYGLYLDTSFGGQSQGPETLFWAPISQLQAHGRSYQTHAVKSWVTAAHHADSYLASAHQAPGAQSPLESTLFWVPRQQPGVQLMGGFNGPVADRFTPALKGINYSHA